MICLQIINYFTAISWFFFLDNHLTVNKVVTNYMVVGITEKGQSVTVTEA